VLIGTHFGTPHLKGLRKNHLMGKLHLRNADVGALEVFFLMNFPRKMTNCLRFQRLSVGVFSE
jgi:hypothetical protein